MMEDGERRQHRATANETGAVDSETVEAHLRRMDRFADQDEAGVDLALIRENLRLSPTERVERNWRRRQEALELRRHVRRIR